ncbi:MAG TPA: hypothetical protein VMT61_14910 [Candidatus Binataceae bacterium]|nr:hypothetical protein [Candidatus Binataceae bacterium]
MSARRKLLVALSWLLIGIGTAHAHGGMAGPDELGPPVGISVTIGLASYFAITLWPTRSRGSERKNGGKAGSRSAR